MYNIIDQSKQQANMSMLLNGTTNSTGAKVDCAKECPCGVPAIPVPDQWLEVMVTGGFKVWHIIFIIIAFVVTIVVVYCCFHRCRIPRTKQEIEADLMRTNLAGKFRDYLQEFPNEPTTFMEALKKVQDLEEKSSEQDDVGARKRKGWLKLKGKDKQAEKGEGAPDKDGPETTLAADKDAENVNDSKPPEGGDKQTAAGESLDLGPHLDFIDPLMANLKPLDFRAMKMGPAAAADKGGEAKAAGAPKAAGGENAIKHAKAVAPVAPANTATKEKKLKSKKEAKLIKTKGEKILDDGEAPVQLPKNAGENQEKVAASKVAPAESKSASAMAGKAAKTRRQRDKPNLSRTKATHAGSRVESTDHPNQLSLPAAQSQHHHQQQHKLEKASTSAKEVAAQDKQQKLQPPAGEAPRKPATATTTSKERKQAKLSKLKPSANRAKTRAPKESTVIQIEPMTPKDLQP